MPELSAEPTLYATTRESLQQVPKELPPVWLYDERGSRLYEQITRLPDYYLPRREAEILRAQAPEIASRTGAHTLVELGSGGAKNTRLLLDALAAAGTLERFVPLDVSAEMLSSGADAIAASYPGIAIEPVIGDFERDLGLLPSSGPRLFAVLGSTIGNLEPGQRAAFLEALAGELASDDALVLGLDLVKDAARLEAAYNDPTGVTESFVRNGLRAVNRELEADFEQRRFAYKARWDPAHEWMDIGLRALEAHQVTLRRLDLELEFQAGEPLRMEISSKFRREPFEREAARAGWQVGSWWTDPAGDFAVAYITK